MKIEIPIKSCISRERLAQLTDELSCFLSEYQDVLSGNAVVKP